MSITKRLGSMLLALALTPAAVACTATPNPTPSATSAASTPTPTESTLSPADQELANAKQAVAKLWAVVDRLTNDPQSSLQDLDTVATGKALTMFQENLGRYRAAKFIGTGSSRVEGLQAVAGGVNAGGRSTWTVTACVDGSETTLVDESGKSVQGPPYRILHKATVVELTGALYVSDDVAEGTC